MLRLLAALIAVLALVTGEAMLVALAAAGATWWAPLLFFAVVLLLLIRLFVLTLKPSALLLVIGFAVAIAALAGTYSIVGAILGGGLIDARLIESDLRRRIEHTRAIQLFDVEGRPVGILPAAYDSERADAPYLAVHMRPVDVPTIFWECVKWLEDRDINEPWVIFGVNFRRLGAAVLSKAIGKRDGASGLAEMVDRSIANTPPRPRQNLFYELPRKISSWHELPALSQIFPDEEALKAAVATHLTILTPTPEARFGGGEIHGVTLAAALIGKRPEELTEAEQALFAAGLNLPLSIGSAGTWRKARERADYCLANAPFGEAFDRDRFRKELAQIMPPQRPLRHPAADAAARLGGRTAALVRELKSAVGQDWPQRVASIRLSLRQPLAGLPERMRDAAREVERQQAGRFAVPLWSGDDAAFIYGAVADSDGNIVSVSNADFDLGTAQLPIGSLGKIAAALALSETDAPNAAILSAFAHSRGPPIMRRLHRIPATNVTRAFAALGWTLPPGQSPKRLAINGAVEIEPDAVLQAMIALNDLIAGSRSSPVSLAGLVREATLIDGQLITPPEPTTLPVDTLRNILTPRAAAYTKAVLGMPLKSGTMRVVGKALKKNRATHAWGKSGTADVGSGGIGVSPTRALWHAGGFTVAGRRLSFVLVVASRNGIKPLGFVQSPAIAPMTIALLDHAIHQFTQTETVARSVP
jgi:hypothetical protein